MGKLVYLGLLSAVLACSGCFEPLKQVHTRSAIDQEVTSAAARSAVAKLDLSPLDPNQTYVLSVRGPTESDKPSVLRALEERLLDTGFHILRESRDSMTLEANVIFAGIDVEVLLFGIPLPIPGATTIQDISVYKRTTITGRARLGLTIWDARGQMTGRIPGVEANHYFSNHTFLTVVGAFITTDLPDFVEPGNGEEGQPKEEVDRE